MKQLIGWGSSFLLLVTGPALAETDINVACYEDCSNSTHGNPDYKACVARAADSADAALNKEYQTLLEAVRAAGKDMDQSPDIQLGDLKDAQKKWIAYRDANCTFEDALAFGGTAIGGNYSSCLCALSYARINDFQRIEKEVMGIGQ